MSLAVKIINSNTSGMDKRTVEATFQRMSDQIRWIDQKLTTKIDNEVWHHFQKQQEEIISTRFKINKLKI
ncbi:hypothetical protein QGM71_03205 [Virgibacillus sp. C22-A2]|uniref:WXG100 family type VII secretion target n=1 Tax=Virgibacillus tibetensis TaxID=3042313 RepID=A0ABU6KBI7_9BACI|nr:hypothetical protein [Virgibacillus sp. C22-A2]